MKHALCNREENGYHDSDFYAIVYDSETKGLSRMVTGSTRYAGGIGTLPVCKDETILKEAERALVNLYFVIVEREDIRSLEQPTAKDFTVGDNIIMRDKGYAAPRNKPRIYWDENEKGIIKRIYRSYSQYGTWERESRLLLSFKYGREAWVNLSKVKMDRKLLEQKKIKEKANRLASDRSWYVPFLNSNLIAM